MRTLELMLALLPGELEDVNLFKEKIPELAGLTDFEIKYLYEAFSEDRYSASYLEVRVEYGIVEEFREWLLTEEHKTEG